jgi:hypothetical protein
MIRRTEIIKEPPAISYSRYTVLYLNEIEDRKRHSNVLTNMFVDLYVLRCSFIKIYE